MKRILPPNHGKTAAPVTFILAWGFLNVVLNLNYPAPQDGLWTLLVPSLEVWVLLLVMCLAASLQRPCGPVLCTILGASFIFLRLFRIGDVLMPMYFNRKFNLYMDSGYIPDLLHLLYHSFSLRMFIFWIFLSLALVALLIWGLKRSLKAIAAFFEISRLHRRFFYLMTVGLLIYLASFATLGHGAFKRPYVSFISHRIVQEAAFILNIRKIRARGLAAVQMATESIPAIKKPLDRLAGISVYLFFVESYGRTVFSNPRYFALFAPFLKKLAPALTADGYKACSRYLVSPTFGGGSWLAFSTLESGVRADSQMRYNFLLHSQVKTLARYFNQAGYRTVSVMPGTTFPWPEGRFFGYQKAYYAWNFAYRGPRFGWSPMADQFVIDYIFRKEVADHRKPLFVRYILISSHAPFNRQPPYMDNWSEIRDGRIYRQLKSIDYPIVWPDLSHAGNAYLRAIIYDFTVLSDYLLRFLKEDALIIILGDHQPNAQLTGRHAAWAVPIHVISRKAALLEPFVERGYTPGLIPSAESVPGPMAHFLADFLHAFSSPG